MGGESYDKMRAAKLDLWNYSQNSSRWTTFRPGPEGHNILRFNNARQDISGLAEIRELPDNKGVLGNVVDLTSIYKSQVNKVTRTVRLFPDHSFTIQDQWVSGSTGVSVTFQWLTSAKATLTPTGVLLEQQGKSLKLNIELPDSKQIPEIIVEDVSEPQNVQDSPNPGISRILIRLKTPANKQSVLKITAIPGSLIAKKGLK
jgi:hypothetical protein